MYDKFARVLRIETFTNDVSFFKHRPKTALPLMGGRIVPETRPPANSSDALHFEPFLGLGMPGSGLPFASPC